MRNYKESDKEDKSPRANESWDKYVEGDRAYEADEEKSGRDEYSYKMENAVIKRNQKKQVHKPRSNNEAKDGIRRQYKDISDNGQGKDSGEEKPKDNDKLHEKRKK